ncbi:MAG: DUF4433 domain-containing protein [Bacteroidales bacterium]|jgi:hypothetical protein|nr:DUF4433 domain-containing protein [Bacteroidales bacterium]NLE33697.1 DUF4433 domain-containing protein [Bacteroidales bacterium]
MTIPSQIYLYRIIHIDNLSYVLRVNEITCPSHCEANPDYINIGDNSLIEHRRTMPMPSATE